MNKLLKNKIWYFLTVLFLVIVVGVVGSAQATLITYYFTGQITSVPNPPPYGLNISVGDPVTGSFAYDPSLGYIQPPPAGMSVVIGGATIQSAGDASLQMIDDSYGVDNFNGYFTPISVNGENQPSGSHAMNFYLADTSQTVFSSTALPVSLDAGSFDIRQGNIFAGWGITVSFSIDTLRAVSKTKKCTTRPLSDFLNAQGSSSWFFPPVKDYVGWTDGNFTTFALVDYAGLANKYISEQTGNSLGTTMRGSITQCARRDGKALVTVILFTTNALGFTQSIEAIIENEFDFLNTPTIFGAKAQDVADGSPAAVGPVTFITNFTISHPGAPLPDLVDVITNSPTAYAPASLNFRSTTIGKCSDGTTEARLDVHEVAHTNDDGEWVYSVEEVKVVDVDGGNCIPQQP